jgi:hypothetical protein
LEQREVVFAKNQSNDREQVQRLSWIQESCSNLYLAVTKVSTNPRSISSCISIVASIWECLNCITGTTKPILSNKYEPILNDFLFWITLKFIWTRLNLGWTAAFLDWTKFELHTCTTTSGFKLRWFKLLCALQRNKFNQNWTYSCFFLSFVGCYSGYLSICMVSLGVLLWLICVQYLLIVSPSSLFLASTWALVVLCLFLSAFSIFSSSCRLKICLLSVSMLWSFCIVFSFFWYSDICFWVFDAVILVPFLLVLLSLFLILYIVVCGFLFSVCVMAVFIISLSVSFPICWTSLRNLLFLSR